MSERKNNEIVFKCKKVTNFALSLQNKLDITVQKFIFQYAINSYTTLERQLT